MFIYQKIHIDPGTEQDIKTELANLDITLYRNNFNYLNIDSVKDQCPTLFYWMRNKNVNPIKVAVIVTRENFYDSTPHIDSQINSLALNFPIKNCENSETIFYSSNEPLEIVTLKKPNGVEYKSIKNKDWSEIGKYILDGATLLNTHVPHKIINRGSEKRIVMSIRFDPDPWNLVS